LNSFRASLAIRERLAKADPANVVWQWDVVTANWRLAIHGDEPMQRWMLIIGTIRRLRDENRLRPDWAHWRPVAEARLAKLQQAQAAPQ
jgi:hypothetical protein